MAESKDGGSFFRKVVRFVANPATDWSEVSTKQDDSQELERSELKAMIERKRRNDFVRKREFDTLRRLRREGLSPEQLAALGGSSKVDDSEVRQTEARIDGGVKAKIDEIEQQMVGEHGAVREPPAPRRTPGPRRAAPTAPQHPADFYNAPTAPVSLHSGRAPLSAPAPGLADHLPPLPPLRDDEAPSTAGPSTLAGSAPAVMAAGIAPLRTPSAGGASSSGWSALGRGAESAGARGPAGPRSEPPTTRSPGLAFPAVPPAPPAAPAPVPRSAPAFDGGDRLAVEVNEVVHDPELDEAVIAFANADFNHCEQSLAALVAPQAPRHRHADTWLVLLDLYRATGQQSKFESMALEFAGLFGRSAPQWVSLPKRVADAAAELRPDTRGVHSDVGWTSPPLLDAEGVARLRAVTLQLPLPWVLDWSALERVDAEAATQLQRLFRQWAPQPIDMRWLGADHLLSALQEAAPTGVRDADPAFWMARLEALRLANRPDQFDEAAIDYCVTYEVSPPSWEGTRCRVRLGQGTNGSTAPPSSLVGEAGSSFLESGLVDDSVQQLASVELSGQLAGDIGATLKQLDRKLGAAALVNVSCARLIRVDFIAAGDLLNWVLSKQAENRTVSFSDAHRLVALFFGAMGINEHARVQLPRA